MGMIERAKLYLLRKRSRTIILLAILTIIATLVLVCVSVGNATNQAIQRLQETMGGYFKIETNTDKGYRDPVDDNLVQQVLNVEGIKAYNGMDITYMLADQIQLCPGRFSMEGDEKARLARFFGNTDSSYNEYFVLHSFSLIEGRHITADDFGKAIISKDLAQQNDLKIGDTFAVSMDPENLSDEQKERLSSHSLEVIGIFQIDAASNGAAIAAECDMMENFVFTDSAFIRNIMSELLEKELTVYSNGVSFFVENPKDMEHITNQVTSISGYDWNGYSIIQNSKLYQESAAPLERLSGLITVMVIVIAFISSIILSLILFLWMRERIHEIGIYISMGITKSKIIGQHVLENLIVTCVAFLLASLITFGASGAIETVAQNSLNSDTSDAVVQSSDLGNTSNNPVALDVQVGAFELAEIYTMGTLIVVISTGISSVLVLRIRPKDILSTMS